MHKELQLPNSQYINTTIGLKYLDGNQKLYLKILNSFYSRYHNLEVETLNSMELKSVMHTIKGLAATLGMERLSQLAETINTFSTETHLREFKKILNIIISDLEQ